VNILAKTAGVVLAAAAVCGLGVETAAAATPSQAGDTGSPGTERLLTYQGSLGGWAAVPLPPYICPPDHPWLQNANLSPGQRVPHGVEVIQKGC
jgi:hypothetical protein